MEQEEIFISETIRLRTFTLAILVHMIAAKEGNLKNN